MKKTLTLAFMMSDAVKIRAINVIGIIDSIAIDLCGTTYRVAYWDNGVRSVTWLYEFEMEDAKCD